MCGGLILGVGGWWDWGCEFGDGFRGGEGFRFGIYLFIYNYLYNIKNINIIK